MPEGMQATLEAIQTGIMERKTGAGLTPVAGERGFPATLLTVTSNLPISGPILADFPWDMPLDAARMALIEVRRGAALIEEGCRAIEAAYGLEPGGTPAAMSRPEAKLAKEQIKEANSQALFEADFARKTAAAQAEAFTFRGVLLGDEDDVVDPPESPFNSLPHEVAGWLCPTHGKGIDKTSPKGRKYRVCPSCEEFEH